MMIPMEKIIQGLCVIIYNLSNQLDKCLIKPSPNLSKEKEQTRYDDEAMGNDLLIKVEKFMNDEQREFENKLKSIQKEQNKKLNLQDACESKGQQKYCSKNNLEASHIYEQLDKLKNQYECLKTCTKSILIMKNQKIDELNMKITKLTNQIEEKNILQRKFNEKQIKKTNESINKDINLNDSFYAEICSLRAVLEIEKQKKLKMTNEIDNLRHNVETKNILKQRVEYLEARCEDLKIQLENKKTFEEQILKKNEELLNSYEDVSRHNKILTQKNEELQWKLGRNNKIVNVLSNNIKTPVKKLSKSLEQEQTDSFIHDDKNSPSNFCSKIKYMVEKSNSVSWTLDIDNFFILDKKNTRPISKHIKLKKNLKRKSLNTWPNNSSTGTLIRRI
ncbi:hypothetical protein HCN44_005641 [Aphidius gifuensis]|uniref:Uncharacterized protein n=1 Tax=Aphidius gifuensis TaxID=684658 RepID=A0A835CUU8_APHGI|nr:hypothetical protein HCN44_005641 [Aphidius gifuensis]